jgi:hypothetical protein
MTSKHPDDARYDDETLLDGIKTRDRYGGKSHMWLKRQMKKTGFPAPIYIGTIPHWKLGNLRRWENGLPTTPPPAQVARGKQGVEVLKEARRNKKPEAPPPPPPVRRRRRPAKALDPV